MTLRKWLVVCMVAMVMMGCSVDHSAPDRGVDSDDENYISGMVLAGGPVQGTVYLKSWQAGFAETGKIDENGHYSIQLMDYWVGPYILEVKGTVGGRSIYLHALGTRGDVSDIVNITPLTELVTGNVLGRDPKTFFEDTSELNMKIVISDDALEKHETLVRERFSMLLQSVNVDTETYNLLNTDIGDETHFMKADALFGLIRLSRNVDQNDAVTISNLVDPSVCVVDDYTDDTDNDPISIDSSRFQQATTHAFDIMDRFWLWQSLFEDDPPTSMDDNTDDYNTLTSLFSDDFLYNGYDVNDFLDIICTSSNLERMTIFNIRLDDFDETTHTATVSFKIKDQDDRTQTFYGWQVERIEGTWKIKGNQQVLSVNAGAYLAAHTSSNNREICLNGIYLYAYAPVPDYADDIEYIEVTGPWINEPLQLKPLENHNSLGVPVYSHDIRDETEPQGYFYPGDESDLTNNFVGEDNAEYVFVMYRKGAGEGDPAIPSDEYKTFIPFASYENDYYEGIERDYKNKEKKSVFFTTFETPGVYDLKIAVDGDYIDVRWSLPGGRSGLSINYMWTPETPSSYWTEDIDNDFTYNGMTLGVDPNRFDIYIRTMDSFNLMIDTFICKPQEGEEHPVPISLIEENLLF